jgi:hypothetical protein
MTATDQVYLLILLFNEMLAAQTIYRTDFKDDC